VQSGQMIKNLSEVQIRDTLTEILNLTVPSEPLPSRIRNFVNLVRGREGSDQ
jgi:hypothetical protein